VSRVRRDVDWAILQRLRLRAAAGRRRARPVPARRRSGRRGRRQGGHPAGAAPLRAGRRSISRDGRRSGPIRGPRHPQERRPRTRCPGASDRSPRPPGRARALAGLGGRPGRSALHRHAPAGRPEPLRWPRCAPGRPPRRRGPRGRAAVGLAHHVLSGRIPRRAALLRLARPGGDPHRRRGARALPGARAPAGCRRGAPGGSAAARTPRLLRARGPRALRRLGGAPVGCLLRRRGALLHAHAHRAADGGGPFRGAPAAPAGLRPRGAARARRRCSPRDLALARTPLRRLPCLARGPARGPGQRRAAAQRAAPAAADRHRARAARRRAQGTVQPGQPGRPLPGLRRPLRRRALRHRRRRQHLRVRLGGHGQRLRPRRGGRAVAAHRGSGCRDSRGARRCRTSRASAGA
jgi:hypothetical protein